MVDEMGWIQKDRYCVIHSHKVPGIITSTETGSRMVLWGLEEGGNGVGFQFGRMRKFWRWDGGGVVPQCECT